MNQKIQTPAAERPLTPGEVQETARAISDTNYAEHPLVQDLQHLLASSVVLFLNYKQYSWCATGPTFQQVHDVFAGFAEAVKTSFDQIAERLRMIGQDPIVNLDQIAYLSRVKQSAMGLTDEAMLGEADANAILMIESIRRAIRVSRDSEDPGTADLLAECLRVHERHEWILRQFLRGPFSGYGYRS
jgi:starvation-inducible DNA-binding protein